MHSLSNYYQYLPGVQNVTQYRASLEDQKKG